MKTATKSFAGSIEEEFLQFVVDAAQQDSFLALDINDWDGQKPVGATPIYAIDSNIIHMFINPTNKASSGEDRSIGYGEVFRSDSVEKKASITLALADFIWHDLSPGRPLLIMPGIDREVATLIQVFASRAVPPSDAVDQIKKLYEHLITTTGEDQRSTARELARQIIDIKRGSRLMALERRKRFAPVDGLLDGSAHDFPPDVLAALTPPRRLSEMLDYSLIRNDWQDLLTSIRRVSPDYAPVYRDIDALAHLDFWNRRLVKLDTPHRLIYITGDAAILRASSQRTVEDFGLGKLPKQSGPTATFLDAFIRHPRSLLDRPGVLINFRRLKDQPFEASSFRAWLRLLLGEYKDKDGNLGQWNWEETRFNLSEEVVTDVRAVANRKPEVLQETRESWNSFTESVSLADLVDGNMFPEGDNDKDVNRDKEYRVDGLMGWLKKNGETLNDEVDRYWRDCVLAFTEFRFLLDIISRRPPTHRRAPQLCLGGDEPQRFLADAKKWLANPGAFNSIVYEESKNKLTMADGGEYNFLVAIAFILASSGNWHSTAFLCAHARLVADRLKRTKEPIRTDGPNGREAAYLEAFSRRHLARKTDDLGICLELVEKATAIYTNECAGEGRAPKSGDPLIERFNAERLAIYYTEQMLTCSGNAQKANVADLIALREKFQEFLRTLDHPDDVDLTCRHVRDLLRHRTLLNIVSIGVFLGKETWDSVDASGYCEQLQSVRMLHARQEEFRSAYSEIVTWSGLAIFGDPRQRNEARMKAQRGIEEALSSSYIQESGFIYEKAKYNSFKKSISAVG